MLLNSAMPFAGAVIIAGAQAAHDWLMPQLAVDIPGSPKGAFASGYKWAF